MAKIIQMDGISKGDSYLFIGSEKTAIIDTGVECFADQLVNKVREALDGRPLDYILLTHSHYDHVCGVPALRREWPDAIVAAHPHAAKILSKESVRKFMEHMSAQNYAEVCPDRSVVGYPLSDYKVDLELAEGMKIDLGDFCFRVIETPGHTKCSISFYDEINQILFASETSGLAGADPFTVEPTYVSSYIQSIKSIRKLKPLPVKEIIQCHNGRGMANNPETFFERSEISYAFSCDIILNMYRQGIDNETILKVYTDIYYPRIVAQPIYAFLENARAAIRTIEKECELEEFKEIHHSSHKCEL